jgi:hypothetical protein
VRHRAGPDRAGLGRLPGRAGAGRRFAADGHLSAVALVTASGGKVGMVDVTGTTSTGTGDLLWSAMPGNNPHAIERIPDIGAMVVATSSGYLFVYGPTAVSGPSTLALVQTIAYDGAHGVWWDDVYGRLLAVGQGRATPFFDATGAASFSRSLSYGGEFYKPRPHAVAFH